MNKFLENNNYQDTIWTIKKLTSVQTSHGKEVESLIKNHPEASHIHSLHNCRQHFKRVKVNLPQTFPENTPPFSSKRKRYKLYEARIPLIPMLVKDTRKPQTKISNNQAKIINKSKLKLTPLKGLYATIRWYIFEM